MVTIYHNPQCRKSRAGLKYLEDNNVPHRIVQYLKEPFTTQSLEKLLVKMNRKPSEVIRTQEEYFRKNLKGRNFNDHEWIRIILENPKLLVRPILERGYTAVIGDPVENIDSILK